MSTLYEAVLAGDNEVVRRLLAAGTPADTPGADDQTPLMEAAARGQTETVRLLLQAGADPRLQDSLALDFAVRFGDPEMVCLLLKAGADPECGRADETGTAERDPDEDEDEDGQLDDTDPPPIFDAVQRGNLEIVQLLVEAGARVDRVAHGYGLLAAAITTKQAELVESIWARQPSLAGALQCAIQSGSQEYLDRLLEAGVDVDDAGVDGPPLVLAASCGRTAMIERLLAAGASLELPGPFERTALGEAVSEGKRDCVRILLDAGARLDSACSDSTLVVSAIWSGRSAVLKLLLERGADPNETRGDWPAPLFLAIEVDKPKMIQLLLEHGASPNGRLEEEHRQRFEEEWAVGATPLMLAARKRNRQAVELLLAAGADAMATDGEGRSAADYAARTGDPQLTELLRQAGAKLSISDREQHDTVLLTAIRCGDLPGARAALEAGASPNAADPHGVSALVEAARRGQLEIVERLLAGGADPNRVSEFGESPLRVASLRTNAAIVRALLAGGAAVNARQAPGSIPADEPNTVFFSGESALHDAAVWGSTDILQILLDAGADVNFAGDTNVTPLVAAINHRRMDSAELLLQAGAVIRPEDEVWVAPYHFARWARNPAFQALARDVADVCGAPGIPLQHLPGAVSFKLTLDPVSEPEVPDDPVAAARQWGETFAREYQGLNRKADAILDQLAAKARSAGYLLLDAGKPLGCGPMVQYLVLLPTADRFEALAAFGVRGNDDELSTADLIRWFRQLDADAPFELRGVSFDTVVIEFLETVKDPRDMAERLCRICSDLAAGGRGDRVQSVTDWLTTNRRVHFWWD